MKKNIIRFCGAIICLSMAASLTTCSNILARTSLPATALTANINSSNDNSFLINSSNTSTSLASSLNSSSAVSSTNSSQIASSAASSAAKVNKIINNPKYIEDPSKVAKDDPQVPGAVTKPATSTKPKDTLPPAPPAPPSPPVPKVPVSSSSIVSPSSMRASSISPSSLINSSKIVSSKIASSNAVSSNTATSIPVSSAATSSIPPSPPSNGWYQSSGNTYYYYNGKPVTGWQVMGGVSYYFSATGELSSQVGIDVSSHQGTINWQKVKAAGINFAFIRVGYRGYGSGTVFLDSCFKYNIENATAAGISCGVYFFSQAITTAEATEEADFTAGAIKGFNITYPVVFDTEYIPDSTARTNTAGLTNTSRTNICISFLECIKSNGYIPMLYSNKNWLENQLTMSSLSAYDLWVAQYYTKVTYAGAYKVWQYTDSGSVDGINTNSVDRDVGLFDYSK